jgi:hypothetical protein
MATGRRSGWIQTLSKADRKTARRAIILILRQPGLAKLRLPSGDVVDRERSSHTTGMPVRATSLPSRSVYGIHRRASRLAA